MLADVIGQKQLLGEGASLATMLDAGSLGSLILWGPPGVGKTTIARLLADATDRSFVQISAIFSGVADLKKVFEAAKIRFANGQGTLLFVDEIHRFNKAQQDGFLPYMARRLSWVKCSHCNRLRGLLCLRWQMAMVGRF
jgi:putative ATPase